jgi:hypothetical protein
MIDSGSSPTLLGCADLRKSNSLPQVKRSITGGMRFGREERTCAPVQAAEFGNGSVYSGCATAMDAQARVRQKNNRVNCRSAASFVVIQTKFFLQLLIVLLDLPSTLRQSLAVTSVRSLFCQASTCLRIGSKFRCIRSTPTEMQSMSENDFECFASTGVNTPATMFPDSVLRIFDFPEADFRPTLTAP